MAYNLSDGDRRHLNELATDKAAKLEAFKAEWSQAGEATIRQELENLEGYLAACSRSEVDDTLDNITFMGDKAAILRQLLGDE